MITYLTSDENLVDENDLPASNHSLKLGRFFKMAETWNCNYNKINTWIKIYPHDMKHTLRSFLLTAP